MRPTPDLVTRFGEPIVGMLFENPEPEGDPDRYGDSMVFYFTTGAGVWIVSRYAPAAVLREDIESMRRFLSGITITPR